MTDHVVHVCPKAPEGLLASLSKNHGWTRSEIPLNIRRHDKCPYCGQATKDMQRAGAEVLALEKNIRSRSVLRGGGVGVATDSGTSKAVLDVIKDLQTQVADLKKSLDAAANKPTTPGPQGQPAPQGGA